MKMRIPTNEEYTRLVDLTDGANDKMHCPNMCKEQTMNKEFLAVFQMSKTIIFEVDYYTLCNNETPHFTTRAAQFCRNKRDYNQGGQAQKSLLRNYPTAMRFFKKWDAHHLHDLTPAQYIELREDLDELKSRYNFIYEELDESMRPYNPSISFHLLAEWSKQEPKKICDERRHCPNAGPCDYDSGTGSCKRSVAVPKG